MKSILFLLFLSIPAPARLTEDLAQLRARYGVETVITMDGAGNGSAIFHKSGLELTCTLAAGKTTSIAIRPLDPSKPLTLADATRLVAANQASAADPMSIVATEPATGYTAWQDKAATRTAIYRPLSKALPLLIFLDPPATPQKPPPPRDLNDF